MKLKYVKLQYIYDWGLYLLIIKTHASIKLGIFGGSVKGLSMHGNHAIWSRKISLRRPVPTKVKNQRLCSVVAQRGTLLTINGQGPNDFGRLSFAL